MQIKKFTAPTLREATEKMKSELGNNSVVLSTKVIEGDPHSGRSKMFELTACIDNDITTGDNEDQPDIKNPVNNSFADELNKLSQKIYSNQNEVKPAGNNSRSPESRNQKTMPENGLDFIAEKLRDKEISENYISLILKQLSKSRSFINDDNLDEHVISSIASMISVKDFQVTKKGKPKVVALVGPTGVGKTTSIAKLAIISKILHNLDVGLVSIDTYRLGAIDQLKIFSEVSNIDLLVAYDAKDMPGILESFKNKDLIFIDTAGRSQKNFDDLKETHYFLYRGKVDETYLVLSATNGTRNLYDAAEAFQMFDYSSIIFTKLDEAVTYGNIFNVAVKYNLPLSFLANGQVIPDDIIAANSEYIANMVYTGKINK